MNITTFKRAGLVAGMCMMLSIGANAQFADNNGMRHERSDGYVTPDDQQVLDKLDKWQDLKYGVIFHWGLYSVPGIIESWPLVGEDVDWIKRPESMTYEEFKQWYWGHKDTFNPIAFAPEEWADIMKRGGMKYMVFTTKHHEGFCMFDTKTTDFSIMNGPFGKNPRANIAKHVFDAFRDQGFMIGAYFSKPDWHSDYYWWRRFPTRDRNVNYNPDNHPEQWQKFQEYTYNQIEELMTGYGPIDILWLDGGQVQKRFNQDIRMDRIAAMGRSHQPGLIVVDRTVKGEFENYQTPEGEVPDKQLDIPWETCMPMYGWGWRSEGTYKSSNKIIATLIEVVAKGGNLLLGVGPTPLGTIDEQAQDRVLSVGKWLDKNGEGIYGTVNAEHYNDGNVWFTKSKDGKTMYAFYAVDDDQQLPDVIEWSVNVPAGKKVRMLHNGQALKCNMADGKVSVRLPRNIDRNASLGMAFAIE